MSQVCNRFIAILKFMHDLVVKVSQSLVLIVLLILAKIVKKETAVRAVGLKG